VDRGDHGSDLRGRWVAAVASGPEVQVIECRLQDQRVRPTDTLRVEALDRGHDVGDSTARLCPVAQQDRGGFRGGEEALDATSSASTT
jgi:hypothetical protein